MLDTDRFRALCRPFAETLFEDVRRLSASPAPRTGVTRLGYSDEEEAVVRHLEALGASLGLETERDAAQNLWMTLPGTDRTLPAIVSGSHADSVLDGGNYDGLAGIASALCTVLWLKENGVRLERDFRVLVIRCEEQGLVGTTAILGKLKPEDLERRFTADGPSLSERLARRGIDPAPFTAGKPLFDTGRIGGVSEVTRASSLRLSDRRVALTHWIVHRRIPQGSCSMWRRRLSVPPRRRGGVGALRRPHVRPLAALPRLTTRRDHRKHRHARHRDS